jgi:hypothetical protein
MDLAIRKPWVYSMKMNCAWYRANHDILSWGFHQYILEIEHGSQKVVMFQQDSIGTSSHHSPPQVCCNSKGKRPVSHGGLGTDHLITCPDPHGLMVHCHGIHGIHGFAPYGSYGSYGLISPDIMGPMKHLTILDPAAPAWTSYHVAPGRSWTATRPASPASPET